MIERERFDDADIRNICGCWKIGATPGWVTLINGVDTRVERTLDGLYLSVLVSPDGQTWTTLWSGAEITIGWLEEFDR